MMKKLLSIIVSLLLAGVSFCQQEGFFNVFEDSDRSWIVEAAIEAHGGGFIFAQHDENADSKGELVKLSEEGNLMNRVVIDLFPSSSYNTSNIFSIFHDPQNPDLYLALGQNWDIPNGVSRPFVVHFDENLDITYAKEVDLPNQYRSLEFYSPCQLTCDGKFLIVFDSWTERRRLYLIIASDGDVEKLYETQQDVGQIPYLGTLFEYPEGNRYGHYKQSLLQPPSPMLTTRLFTLDENFDSISSKEFTSIIVDTIDIVDTTYIQSFRLSPTQSPTVKPLDDTTLLFYDRIREMIASSTGSTQHEYSTVLFKTDLEGNILDYRIIGSWNDHYDLPAEYQSFNFVNSHLSSEKLFYICNMELYDDVYYFHYNKPNPIVVTKMNENLELVWQKYYSIPTYPLRADYVLATRDGGCLVLGSGHKNAHYEVFALKIDSEGSVGIDNVSSSPFMFYPTPTQDQLHLQYSPDVKPKQIELYDLQGRLVRTQSQGLESVDMQSLAPGQYLMRITLEDGKSYMDKVVKE